MTSATASVRRRGDALVDAIFQAVLDELADVGYEGLSIERVAERAHTGKASIYRRWPNKLELVLGAVEDAMPSVPLAPDTGSVHDDLVTVLWSLGRDMNSARGSAMRACMADVKHHHELSTAVHDRLLAPRTDVIAHALRQGIERGEVRPESLTPRILELGPTLLYAQQMHGQAITEADVRAIVDEVLMPVLAPPSGD